MMAKIVQGSCFRGVVNYVLNRDEAHTIATKGIRNTNKDAMINSFEIQSKLNPITKSVAHISLNFSTQDKDKLTDKVMAEIADEYLKKMGYGNTQVLMVRHEDKKHPHVHMILNRIDFNGKRISDQNERLRSTKICKDLTLKYGLYMSSGKENVNRNRLREPDKTKYMIYDSLVKNVPLSKSWKELQQRLKAEDIEIGFKTKGSTSQIEGVRFTANNITFNGSKVDKQFSYSKIDFTLKQNAYVERQSLQPTEPTHNQNYDQGSFSTALGGLFDFSDNPSTDPEEESFRKRMQQKKKKGIKRKF